MESIEHTKLKPLTIPLCVSDDFRILGIEVGKIPAKGHLAELSRKKYGPRSNERELVFRRLLTNLRYQQKVNPMTITTDSYPLYANLIREYFPAAKHIQIVARDLKEKKRELMHQKAFKKVFDPLFALNQRCAKLRSDVRRMTRRSWCTTKKIENLQRHLKLYQVYNNNYVLGAL